MARAVRWTDIPNELKELRQWCVSFYAHPDKSKQKAPRMPINDAPFASVDNPQTWGTFDQAAQYAWEHGTDKWCVGLILTRDDPFCVIDLDVKDAHNAPDKPHLWTTQEEMEQYWRIAQEADTYVERSLSGKSLHVLVRANIGAGARHRGIEIYSQDRYIICTGDKLVDKPVRLAQQMMEKTLENLRSVQVDTKASLIELEEVDDDEYIIQRLQSAENAPKFEELFNGRWEQYNYPSQSEADLALLSMFCFYSQSNEQCRRLFRLSELGKREKAVKNDKFLNFTLSIIRGRQEREAAIEIAVIKKQGEALLAKLATLPPVSAYAGLQAPGVLPPPALPGAVGSAPVAAQVVNGAVPYTTAPERINEGEIDWPPGFIGDLAKFIFECAPRPVKEVGIVAAFGLMAGICGKVYNIPQSGLNIYFILVAKSAIGKEAMHTGLGAVLESLRERNPVAMNFVDFSEFASGPALIKACIGNPSFVNVCGEWGRKLKRFADDSGKDGASQTLRTAMTNLYQKSSSGSIVGGISYSKKDDNVQSVIGVAYSIIGETTPSTYYDSLTESMMEDGFLSRFTMLEYTGKRPPRNKTPRLTPHPQMADYLAKICSHALQRITGLNAGINVLLGSEAAEVLDAFDLECDSQINDRQEEAWRQMWNRAHLKALRFAALMACGDNYVDPVITKAHAEWAITLIRRDIRLMQVKISEGDVGHGDDARERKLIGILRRYLDKPVADGYEVPIGMQKDRIVQRKFLQFRTCRIPAFCKHRSGSATAALDLAIRSLVDSGYLKEMSKDKLLPNYGFQGKCYLIIDLPQ